MECQAAPTLAASLQLPLQRGVCAPNTRSLSLLPAFLGRLPRRLSRRHLGHQLCLAVDPMLEVVVRRAPLAHEANHAEQVVLEARDERREREESRRLLRLDHAGPHMHLVGLTGGEAGHAHAARADPLAVDAHLARAALALAA